MSNFINYLQTRKVLIQYLLITIISVFMLSCDASIGDQEIVYRKCVRSCLDEECKTEIDYIKKTVLSWNCEDDCLYICMRNITLTRTASGLLMQKYFGHWPFIRIWGLQEPASVLFSFGNLLPHFSHLISNRKAFAYHDSYFMRPWLMLFTFTAIMTWVFSMIYHTKRNGHTAQWDYVSALVFTSFNLWLAICRTIFFPLRNSISSFSKRVWTLVQGIAFLTLTYLLYLRIVAMLADRVPFSSHLHLCIAIMTICSTLWVVWALCSSDPQPHRYTCLLCQILFAMAATLEILDFPPIVGVFDAHSLWHAATIPIGFLWYRFWRRDAEVCSAATKRQE